MAILELKQVCKSYETHLAVDNLSFSIEQGSVFGLLGPNGAGKTSSIRMMIGITVPDTGEVGMFGAPFHRGMLQMVGYLPEERGLYKKMKVLEMLVFLAQLKGLDSTTATKRATEWMQRLDLGDWLKNKIEELSKGMQQKVQFIAAVLHDPEFLILDEPFSGLDPSSSLALKDALLELKKQGKTILFSTHRMDTVERLCDTICLINHGRNVLSGDLKEIKASYGRSAVQLEYEGEMPFLSDRSLVQSYNNFGNYVELKPAPGRDPQELLNIALKTARVMRFEVVEPSLEEIFIDIVDPAKAVNHA
ncbi:MAG TPA: ATP-binding cassette domain-containing protein [candidate division Zixibacteria bacterium]|nr:ATP-binding cassette domain-containing protein [candidate division Zixibacteria bacterium]